ncbi:carboxypeptidase-like regulatory domain-containing protein [Prevotella histicola]|uniref:carboxypeptidase-like regulatory domain-containing protein n=1 Tax=Prevotella histicola TaxID=470565 RepID=UPI001C5EFFCD|nr:carboxypeptidase-like regulatory domain-containing protein [Prevotella histicola]MBW4739005.1 carboxypeptidase-like regulatory domain-containing protein [Prevotella histicola]MBW4747220.1 carboxypeptidase-like regulatory domain-containing protein [Prevotella histicola]
MAKGKSTCKLLKSIRQQIADANGISYQPKECHYEGDCAGTCPACEEEIRYLERELKVRKGNGFGMKVAGIAAGICATVMPMTAAAQAVKPDSTANPPVQTTKKAPIKVVDLSDSCASPVIVRGMVIDSEDNKPLVGASILIDGTTKETVTNVDGQFALKVPSDTSLVISSIEYNSKIVRVSSLLRSDNNVIMLEKLVLKGAFAVVTVNAASDTGRDGSASNIDDVYGHKTYRPKSHKEKNKKKCK